MGVNEKRRTLSEGTQYEVYIVVNHHPKHGEDDEQREGTAYRVSAFGGETPNEVVANCLRSFADELDPRTEEAKHASDCAVHREPAFPAGPCDCGAPS